ncbi:MAG: CoA-binding protein [Candidatus Aenigmarchaeota archaeon]|nr:CoA-binding protein [Candidatus Aenigmarchaeota archaeon]
MSLSTFFNPESVAIIGASHTPGKVGYAIVENFVRGKFKGKIYPVNPDTSPILGLRVYKSILEISDNVDLGIIAIPSTYVPKIVKECVHKKIPSLIIISGGFSEIGQQGKLLEDEIKHHLKNSKTRIIGPNCIGVLDTSSKTDTLFLSQDRLGRPTEGNIAFISQSGAVGSTILDWLSEESIGISKFISYGNAIDVNELDLLDFLSKDKQTKVISVYLEGIKSDGKYFLKKLKEVSKKKPVIILKAGKTERGTRAVASHTGSLAGSAKIYSAVFKQSGAIEAENWEELFDFAKAFSTQPLPSSNKLAIITDGGGFGVLATDEAEKQKLILPEPSQKIISELKKHFPSYVILHNPIDLIGDANDERYQKTLDSVLSSSEYSGAVVITLFQVPTLEQEITEVISSMKKYKKPIICCAVGSQFTRNLIRKLEKHGIPVYSTPEVAVKCFSALLKYSQMKK